MKSVEFWLEYAGTCSYLSVGRIEVALDWTAR
jgi:hypothetical protein